MMLHDPKRHKITTKRPQTAPKSIKTTTNRWKLPLPIADWLYSMKQLVYMRCDYWRHVDWSVQLVLVLQV